MNERCEGRPGLNGFRTRRWFRGGVVCFLALCALGSFSGEVWGNGNVSADAPVQNTVRKAPVKRPVRRASKKKLPPRRVVAPQPARVTPPSSLERGIALMEQERYGAARPWLQKAVQEERRNPYAWYWFGRAHEATGEFAQAQFFYTRALEADPAFPPLSRIVAFPDDGERKPLWDPLRPARIYPIPTNDLGVAVIPPDAPQATRRPPFPAQPEGPKVPVYVPPLPAPALSSGDAPQPPVYVPPPSGSKY